MTLSTRIQNIGREIGSDLLQWRWQYGEGHPESEIASAIEETLARSEKRLLALFSEPVVKRILAEVRRVYAGGLDAQASPLRVSMPERRARKMRRRA